MKKKSVNLLLLTTLLILVSIFLFYDSFKLGFFADDISFINGLNKVTNINQLGEFNIYFDAGRELQPFWMWLFLNIANFFDQKILHLIQIFIYLTNSFLLFIILKSLNINNKISIIVSFYFLLFPLYAEVAFWTHNLAMTLLASFFFLIFLILNINQYKKSNLINELYIILFSILSIFTYEQYIYAIYAVILLRLFFKEKIQFTESKKLVLFLNTLIIIAFSIYKLNEMKSMMLEEPNFNFLQIIQNVMISIYLPFKTIVLFEYSIEKFAATKFILIIFGILIAVYFFNNVENKKKTYNQKFNSITCYKLTLCILIYFAAFFPIYFHSISPRHFYLPSIFIMIGLASILDFFIKKNLFNQKLYKFTYLLLIVSTINNGMNLDQLKYSQIMNYKMKENFYKDIIKKLDNKENINLINFPFTYNNTNFFASEQPETIQFMLNDKNLPLVSLNLNLNNNIEFKNVFNNKIIYKILKN